VAGGEIADAYLRGSPCPKCAYIRTPADTNPAWQCPKCLIAYAKFKQSAAPIVAQLADGGRELAAEAKADSSAWSLVIANLFTLAVAAETGMTLKDLVIVYWVQGLVIGLSFSLRILCLRPGTVTRRLPDGSDEPVTTGSKIAAASGILLAVIGLHFFYAMFIFTGHGPMPSVTGILLCAMVFIINHGYSLIINVRRDRRDHLRLGTLVSIPFFRIAPMHFFASMGLGLSPLTTNLWGLLFFTSMKTGADVVSHLIEHHELRMGSSLRWLRDAHFEREMWLAEKRQRQRRI